MPRPKKYIKSKSITFNVFIGIDPGASGGLAVLMGEEVFLRDTPSSCLELLEWFLQWRNLGAVACIELVGGYVARTSDGLAGGEQPGSAMFKFGVSYGRLQVACSAAGIGLEEVSPLKWQRHIGIESREHGEKKADFKRRLKEKAGELFPELGRRITLATCDALLIAKYCRDTYK